MPKRPETTRIIAEPIYSIEGTMNSASIADADRICIVNNYTLVDFGRQVLESRKYYSEAYEYLLDTAYDSTFSLFLPESTEQTL
jgi:hypothetical protein